MNFGVSEITEIALQILDYSMFDRSGASTDSLSQLIEKHQFAHAGDIEDKQDGQLESSIRDDQLAREQFMAEFDIPDSRTFLHEPNQYVKQQMLSFLEQLEERLMQTKMMVRYKKQASDMRDRNSKPIRQELSRFCATVQKDCTKAIKSTEMEYKRDKRRSGTKANYVIKQSDEKQNEMLDEFNMLLQLLKIIVDDLPEDWKQLDRTVKLLQLGYDAISE